MQVTQSSFTIAEYCAQMTSGSIRINKDYQRTAKVWPAAAKSYLLETILLGYPIPKICLYQKTDARTRTTTKEIVDGQQRSATIFSFFNGDIKIGGSSSFKGSTYSQLDEPDQSKFLSYAIGTDVFVGATDAEIREVFRRMNSYTVPLNGQEKRHATNQGRFKWMIVDICNRLSDPLKFMGIFGERQFARMADSALFAEYFYGIVNGHESASEKKIDGLYKQYDESFPEQGDFEEMLRKSFEKLQQLTDVHETAIMKPYNVFSLLLAISHAISPVDALETNATPGGAGIDLARASENLSAMAEALETDDYSGRFSSFVEACSKATNRINQRKIRFASFYEAIASQ